MCTIVHHRSIDMNDGGGHLGARCRLHGGAGEGTAKRPDLPPSRPEPARSDHRGNGRARTHAHTGDEACEALEKLPEKDIDRAQSERRMRIFVAAKALTSSADINLDDEEHGSLSSV